MVLMLTPLSLWVQLSSGFFTLCGFFGDLLVIRLCLVLAYICLSLNALLGSPLWPSVYEEGQIAIDALVWSLINLYVHGSSLICLIRDERAVELHREEEALWRMFYRTGGLSARLFKTIISPNMSVVQFNNGELIPTDDSFYILYEGKAHLEVIDGETVRLERYVGSGGMFDLEQVGMFREDSTFKRNRIRVRSFGCTKLFRFQADDMQNIAHHPFTKGVWQSLLIYNLSYVVEAYTEAESHEANLRRIHRDKIFDPLQNWELPEKSCPGSGFAMQNPLNHLVACLKQSFSPPSSFYGHTVGIRQTLLSAPLALLSDDPSTGPMFRLDRRSGDKDEEDGSIESEPLAGSKDVVVDAS